MEKSEQMLLCPSILFFGQWLSKVTAATRYNQILSNFILLLLLLLNTEKKAYACESCSLQ